MKVLNSIEQENVSGAIAKWWDPSDSEAFFPMMPWPDRGCWGFNPDVISYAAVA